MEWMKGCRHSDGARVMDCVVVFWRPILQEAWVAESYLEMAQVP